MSCICTPAKPAQSCATALIVGTYTPDTDVRVVFTTATSRVDVFYATTDEDGVISIDSPGLRTNTLYQYHVNLPADAINHQRDFTVGGTEVTCVSVEFTPAFALDADDETEMQIPATETIELV